MKMLQIMLLIVLIVQDTFTTWMYGSLNQLSTYILIGLLVLYTFEIAIDD